MNTRQMDISVWRGDAEGGGFTDFRVPARDSQTVLDVVAWIQQNREPTLAYRHACRVGMCGSCAMTVNGRPRWTCRTHVRKVLKGNRIVIAPLRNLPVIRDLVCDMDPFFGKLVAAEAVFRPTRSREEEIDEIAPDSAARRAVDAAIECINCGICEAACDVVSANPDYLGPAALNRAWTLFNDVRHKGHGRVPGAVAGPGGCHNCHAMGNCAQFCPKALAPMTSIAGLKGASARAFLRRGVLARRG